MKKISILNQDILAGALFFLGGALLLFFGRDYSMGTLMRIGPGFLPRVVGWALIAVSLFQFVRGMLTEGPSAERWALKPLIVLSLAFFAFAFMIETVGLILTGMAVVLLASLAGHRFVPRSQIPVIVLAPIVAAILFVYLLGVPMQYWPAP